MGTESDGGAQGVQEYLRADEPRGWLLLADPFRRVEGGTALLVGVGAVAATALLGLYGGIAYDGVADLHVGQPLPPALRALLPVADWLIAVAVLGLAGRLFSRSRQRLVDYLGMVGAARLPMAVLGTLLLPGLLGRFLEPLNRLLAENPQAFTQRVPQLPGLPGLVAVGVVTVVLVIWTAVLTYFALQEASGMSRGKALAVFVGAALVAEVLSKIAVGMLGGLLGA